MTHMLLLKKESTSLENILDEAVKTINFIKTQPTSTCLFNILWDEMGCVHEVLFAAAGE